MTAENEYTPEHINPVESNPGMITGQSAATPPLETPSSPSADAMSNLEQKAKQEVIYLRIITELSSRPLPIQIKQGEKIIDLERYAKIEAGQAYDPSPFLSRPARERLELLGISVDE